jgi:hypothetical protein
MLHYDKLITFAFSQIEELGHTFKPTTIQEMELMVLKALDWRLSCVTAFSFAYLTLGPAGSGPMNDKVTRLLLHSLLGKNIHIHIYKSIMSFVIIN